jgi:aminopeptidase-like protein
MSTAPRDPGVEMDALARELFPITRCLAGPGYRETIDRLEQVTGPLTRHRIATGERVLDWEVPREWELREAWIRDPDGRIVVDARGCNLHVVSHSVPVRARLPLVELQEHLHSLPALPEAIPYRTSYYHESWGFCLADEVRRALPDGEYEVCIDAELRPGHIELAEAVVPGRQAEEVLFSTYCCHPSMANNELSGPVVVTHLARALRERARPRLTYRFLFVPETIGSIAYLDRFGQRLHERLVAGWVVTCCGDPGDFTFKRSRRGDTLADRVTRHVLAHGDAPHREVDFYPAGSDERQYSSPGYDLPVASLMRTMYNAYPEYHTSLDDLSLITPQALAGTLAAYLRIVETLEVNETLQVTVPYGEPNLGRRGLYGQTGGAWIDDRGHQDMMFLLNFCDGGPDLLAAAERCRRPIGKLAEVARVLKEHGLLRTVGGGAAARDGPETLAARAEPTLA